MTTRSEDASTYRILKPLPRESRGPETRPLVSIIIPTLNAGSTLERCLLSIRNQTWDTIETTIVDGGSKDSTLDLALKFADAVFSIPGERSEARNLGAHLSRGQLLAFIDSDMYLHHEVIEQCVAAFRLKETCAVVLPELAIGEGFWASCRALEKKCSLEDLFQEAARCFSKSAWNALKGFDVSLGPAGEDWDLTLRARELGIPVVRTVAVVVHDEGRLSLKDAARDKYYYGRYIARYISRHPSEARRQLTLLRPSYYRSRRLLASQPLTTTGMIVLKGVELLAGWRGYRSSIRESDPIGTSVRGRGGADIELWRR